MKSVSLEMKVGLFAVLSLVVLIYMTVRVSERGVFKGGDYTVTVVIQSAEGLNTKTPVEVAGIQVGYIETLELEQGHMAKARLKINRAVKLGKDARAQVRTKGFLGETYVDLLPGDTNAGVLGEGQRIQATNPYVDLGQIAADMREITASIKKLLSEEDNGPVTRILGNMETFTEKLSQLTVQNQENINEIVANLKLFSQDLSGVMSERKESLKDTMDRINNITRKVDEGRGTLGQLVNNGETADNINEAARGLSETLGGVNRFQFEMGYHLEYLTTTKDFKSYAGLALRPRPDKYFLFEFVVDPNPSPTETVTTTSVTSGGTTTTITTDANVVAKDRFLISAQIAKSFYDFTIRGGVIESRGGVGLDFNKGPFGIQFSAFDFRTNNNQRPHLKALGTVNVTRNFFLVSGVDDFISKQHNPDWFAGAGFRLIDNDIKSLVGVARLK